MPALTNEVKKNKYHQLENENDILKHIVSDIWWMARRCADGRSSYAVSSYNDAVRRALRLGVDVYKDDGTGNKWCVDKTPWARDGGGQNYSGLTKEEYELGDSIEEWSKAVYPQEYTELQKENQELKKVLQETENNYGQELHNTQRLEKRVESLISQNVFIQNKLDHVVAQILKTNTITPELLEQLKALQV